MKPVKTYLKTHMANIMVLAALLVACSFGMIDASTAAIGGAVLATRPFPIDPKLTAIALAYRNPDIALIADEVLPVTPVDAEFKHLVYDLAQGYTVPDAKVGRKSAPTEVEFNATEVISKVEDFGLDDLIPNEDINDDNQGVDPLGTAAMYLTNLVRLAREIRVAGLVFANGTYAAGNKATLSGTSQWSDQVNSDPVVAIGNALDVPIMRPNIAVFGQATWTNVRRHPKIVQAIKGTNQGAGMVSRADFAEFFELQNVLVGAGFVNNAKKGQTASMARVWGKHAAFIYRDRAAGPQAGVTFGYTGAKKQIWAGQMDEPKVGLEGSVRVRVGERVKEVIAAPEVAYYFENAVA